MERGGIRVTERTFRFSRLRLSKIGAFFGLYAIVVSVPTAIVLFGARWLQARFASSWWMIPVTSFGVLATIAPIVYLAIVRKLESQALVDQRRYHRTLIAASSGMTRIKELSRLCSLIVHMVNHTVRISNTCLFLYEPKEKKFILTAVRYRSMIPLGMEVEENDPLVHVLRAKRDLVVLGELQTQLAPGHPTEWMKELAWVYSWMRKMEASLLVPSFSGERLLGFLVLGTKRSKEAYTMDDIAIFSGLANQAALAIENALFFDELRTNEAHMIQSEKLASLGQLASGMAHEIHNPLTIISGESQLYLERFKDLDPKVDALLKSIIEECQRAADITRRILRFAKPAPTDVSPVDLKHTTEESLTLAGYQVRMDMIERVVEMPDDLPRVRSNQNQLQEVLLNLILNAAQAMGEKGGKIMLSATANGSSVTLKVADNGPGIPPNKLKKVFDPFYTTKPTGTGLGLFVTERIVKSHGGTIDLESEEGKGTCFTIKLPVWREKALVSSPGGSHA